MRWTQRDDAILEMRASILEIAADKGYREPSGGFLSFAFLPSFLMMARSADSRQPVAGSSSTHMELPSFTPLVPESSDLQEEGDVSMEDEEDVAPAKPSKPARDPSGNGVHVLITRRKTQSTKRITSDSGEDEVVDQEEESAKGKEPLIPNVKIGRPARSRMIKRVRLLIGLSTRLWLTVRS